MTPTDTCRQRIESIETLAHELGPVKIMEVCGTHTVSLFRSGVKSILPPSVQLLSGPGCPVCVTSQGYIDAACELARREGVMVCSYGDMMRVPGRSGTLDAVRASGAQVKVVYSAREAVQMARRHPDQTVVFLAVGFETTAPASAAAVLEAERDRLENFTLLTAHKRVIPAMEHLLQDPDSAIDAFLCPGHVSVIIGADAFRPLVRKFHKPCVVGGFEAEQMLEAIERMMLQLKRGVAMMENVYYVAVSGAGNSVARDTIAKVFAVAPTVWRAIGEIPASGLELRRAYRRFDARYRFKVDFGADYELPGCRCGSVIQGKLQPMDCPLFGVSCTPLNPIGPCMVSSEGTCAAWYKYGGVGARK